MTEPSLAAARYLIHTSITKGKLFVASGRDLFYIVGLFIILFSAYYIPLASADENFTVTIGQNKTFTEFNYNNAFFDNCPSSPYPWPEDRIATASGNTAYVSLSATSSHCGMAAAESGVQINWNLGPYNWDDIDTWPITIKINFSYDIGANWKDTDGSANAVVYLPNPPTQLVRIGRDVGILGDNKNSMNYEYKTTLEYIRNYNGLVLQAYCQAGSESWATSTHTSHAQVKINAITIEFLPRPDPIDPIILVHGYDMDKFNPYDSLDPMAKNLTGDKAVISWEEDRKRFAGNGNIVYIISYTHDLTSGTHKDIREYAKNLAQEIEKIKTKENVDKVDIVAHSMGGLVSRAYIESGDFGADLYKNDVDKLIMLGTPNHGAFGPLFFGLTNMVNSISGAQMLSGSNNEFLNKLNHGCPTCRSGEDKINPLVEYYTISGDCIRDYSDGIVEINSVKLSNVRNFIYPVLHTGSLWPLTGLLTDDAVYQKINEILTDTITSTHERDPLQALASQAPTIALRAANGQYLCAETGGGDYVVANRDKIGTWESFKLIDLGDGNVALLASNGQAVCAEFGGGFGIVANRNAIDGWETFKLINLGNNNVALQAANGQYVCAEFGGGNEVVANRNAIAGWETFRLVYIANYALQAANGQYVCAEFSGGGEVVANRNAIAGWETFGLLDRGNGNIALRVANGQYVCAEAGGGGAVVANRNAIAAWETFGLVNLGNDNIALRVANGQYVCAEGGGGGAVVANRNAIGAWETFKLIPR